MKRWIPCAVFAIFCLVAAIPAESPDEVNVTGKVEFSNTAKPDSSGVVVWLDPVGTLPEAKPAVHSQHQQLLQKNKTFLPHLLVVEVGSTVDFPNQDPFFHNVFSLFEGKRFDLGLYEAGATRPVVFNKLGISYIFCNIHPEMSAVVIALKTPYYAISGRNGTIEIPNVLSGKYELHVWHERVLPEALNGFTHTVMIAGASSSLGVIRLSQQRSLMQDHKNKYGKDYDPLPDGTAYPKP